MAVEGWLAQAPANPATTASLRPLSQPARKHHFRPMPDDPPRLLWTLAALFAASAALAAWRDHARAKRRDIDRPGWVPWQLVLVLSLLLAVVFGALGVLV